MRSVRSLSLPVLVFGATLLGVGVGRQIPKNIGTAYAAEATAPPPVPASALRQTSENFRAIAKRVGPAVVVIKAVKQAEDPYRDFFDNFGRGLGGSSPHEEGGGGGGREGLGSGFIIDKAGYIVTNNHVVEGATKVTVSLSDDEAVELEAKVVGTDPKTDLAVIKIKPPGDLPIAEWADSDGVEVGDWAVAIGSPFMLSHSVTSGIVSAKGRNASHLMGADFGYELIQTDAAINPGNSGGPLCTLEGKVMGVNSMIYTQSGGYMGIGFAIPSNLARGVTSQLIQHGKVTRGWLGVAIQKATPDLLKDLGASHGIAIHQVTPDSPASRAGLQAGDLVTDADGVALKDSTELQRLVSAKAPGTKVSLKVISYASKKSSSVNVTLGELPGSGRVADATPGGGREETGKLGLALSPAPGGEGVQVQGVRPGSAAQRAGLMEGDVIVSVNRHAARSVGDFQARAQGNEKLNLLVRRNGNEIFLQLSRTA